MMFSNKNRHEMINKLKKNQFDVLIIGGGITGAGIAFDASSRGMKTALVEMQDFASGTSSRSTKLVHGGLRYLKNLEVKLVAEVGKERAVVYENGPHVTTPEWMLLPIYKGGTFGRISTSIGLRAYDYLAGVKREERRRMLDAQETAGKVPLIKKEGLQGAGYYVEYRTDDARLTIEVLKAAYEKGAVPINYSKAYKLLYNNNEVAGVMAVDQLTGEEYEIKAHTIVNASGPWVDFIRDLDGSKKGKTMQLTKGVHVVFDQSKLPLEQAVYFDTPDNRMIFAIPRNGKTYVGTTDTFYNHDPKNPKITMKDRDYLIHAINDMFPDAGVRETDIESSWAGVRPLISVEGKDPSEISRKDEIWEAPSGLITIAGGKLTGYRKMAETVVNLLARKLIAKNNRYFLGCMTKALPISGGDVGGSRNYKAFIEGLSRVGIEIGLTQDEAFHLVSMYGSNAPILFKMIETDSSNKAEKYEMPITLWVKLKYALEYEMASTPSDFFIRRTGDLLFDIHSVRKYRKQVHYYMSEYFGWSEKRKQQFTMELEQELNDATTPDE
ncbi:FAD-dependent oxidoreductase [Bacillus sp. JJ1773]|uniref:glycerol-3-phosphate dehydrogenase/oxidase n=1 Tax=Bacillus sp. JJ1773 TaxID=3122965 RepID=UPI002FFF69C3